MNNITPVKDLLSNPEVEECLVSIESLLLRNALSDDEHT